MQFRFFLKAVAWACQNEFVVHISPGGWRMRGKEGDDEVDSRGSEQRLWLLEAIFADSNSVYPVLCTQISVFHACVRT